MAIRQEISKGQFEVTYEGLVLKTYERNGRDDSDFLAIVWDLESNRPMHIEYATTRAWTYNNSAIVDATPEIQAKYEAWRKECEELNRIKQAALDAADPKVGKELVVTGGKKHNGKSGRCFWRGANGFRTYYKNGYNQPDQAHNQRVGIETAEGEKFYTDLLNVRVKGHEDMDPGRIIAEQRVAAYIR